MIVSRSSFKRVSYSSHIIALTFVMGAVLMAAPSASQALDPDPPLGLACEDSSDCPDRFKCKSFVDAGCSNVCSLDDGECTTECDEETQTIKRCVPQKPPKCSTNSDCDQIDGTVCAISPYDASVVSSGEPPEACSGSDCTSTDNEQEDPVQRCIPKWRAPCESSEDCGSEDFECTRRTYEHCQEDSDGNVECKTFETEKKYCRIETQPSCSSDEECGSEKIECANELPEGYQIEDPETGERYDSMCMPEMWEYFTTPTYPKSKE